MKKIPLLLLLAVCALANAQNEQFSFFSTSYSYVTGSKDPVIVKKSFFLSYNGKYGELVIGDQSDYFTIYAYDKKVENGNIVETFWNDEAKSLPQGWYSFKIEHNKNGGAAITLNLPKTPGGAMYYVEKAEVYSENGKVNGNLHVKSLTEVERQASGYYNNPPYYDGAKSKVKIDSFLTARLVDSLHLDTSKWIANVDFELDVDTFGNYTVSNYSLDDHSASMGFYAKQTKIKTYDDNGQEYHELPLNVDAYNQLIYNMIWTLPKFEPARDDKGRKKATMIRRPFVLGGSDHSSKFN